MGMAITSSPAQSSSNVTLALKLWRRRTFPTICCSNTNLNSLLLYGGPLFPGGQVTDIPYPAKVLPENGTFYLEGHALQAVEVGQSDTYNTTVLHVPDLDLVVGGDVAYGHCHQLFAEDSTSALRNEWLNSLDKVAALKPKLVIPSHMQSHDGYRPSHIDETEQYIRLWEQLRANSSSWQELEARTKKNFPHRTGNFLLRWGSQAPFNASF